MSFIVTINNNEYKFNKSKSIIEIINNIYSINKDKYIAVYINNKIYDLNTIINYNSKLEFIEINSIEYNNILIRSCTYILGYSIKSIFPNSKLLKSNIINNKFYYDFYLSKNITNKDIYEIEKCMKNISLKKIPIIKKNIIYKDFKNILYNLKETYKINFLKEKYKNFYKYNLYFCENYVDYCKGINFINTKFIKNFILEKSIYQYWYGNKINKMSYRIYGNLSNINNKLNNNFNNDHRNINKYTNLYNISKKLPGMIYWNNNGLFLYNELKNFIRSIFMNNYYEVKTPIIMEESLWKKTGHMDFYSKNIYNIKIDDRNYCIKPMNCPGHVKIFKNKIRSYRDLPYRIFEFGNCHRNELSGSLHGLMRTRSFCQDDTHIFCSIDQIESEINDSIYNMYFIYNIFNFKNIKIQLSTRPNNKIGNEDIWDYTEKIIKNILDKNNIIYIINDGEGAFYGPKIEFILLDSLNRSWQCGTIQLDFFLSKNLNSTYIDSKNKKKNPIIIHKAILGSIERFIGIITEHYKGKYPLWLSPIQVVITNITKNQLNYTLKIFKMFLISKIRTKLDIRNETINYKIMEHSKNNIPYIVICGDKEVKEKNISVRTYYGDNLKNISINKFIKIILKIIKNKKIIKSKYEVDY